MKPDARPVVLIFVGNYLPGYKAGGILRTIVNAVDHLHDEFDFRVVTRDRDLGDAHAYAAVKPGEWHDVGHAKVCYLGPESITVRRIAELLRDVSHQALWLNSFFDPLTVKALFNMRLGRARSYNVSVAPRGEFAWASLKQKYPKKLIFMLLARAIGLYENITWHASSQGEADDIVKVMKVRPEAIRVMDDFPIKSIAEQAAEASFVGSADGGESLRLVYLSRVAREKNLDYALRVLGKVGAKVVFDIYGPVSDAAYWKECQALIARLPANVTVNYRGAVALDQVVDVFSRYDGFLFPTGGEAYGHVIAECLAAGTPVIVSTETSWRELRRDGLGWDIDLGREDEFVKAIEEYAALDTAERRSRRATVKAKVMERLMDPAVFAAHRRLFGASS